MTSVSKELFRPLRSYVLRKGRITKAQKKAITEFREDYILPTETKTLDFSKAFEEPENLLIAEVGFGSGESLLNLAESNTNANIIGIEVYLSGIGKVLNQIKKRRIKNLKIINHDVVTLFSSYISNEIFDYLILLYPDPWPKRKHRKRRLLGKEFLKQSYKKLKHGGYIYFKTDWEEYFLSIEKEFSFQKKWIKQEEKDFPTVLKTLSKTNYEIKAAKEGRRSLEVLYKKL